MKAEQLARKIQGIVTLATVQQLLNVERAKAIYYIHRLRQQGYVKTKYQPDKTRVYYISPQNALGGTSYIEILNKYSPIKLISTEVHQIYGRTPTVEETLVYALGQHSVRFSISSLALFRKIKNWSLLYQLAKKNNLIREIVALYDVARLIVPKVRRMPQRFRNGAIPKKKDNWKYIVDLISSRDFRDIERKWKIYIPLNWADLEDYKRQ